MALPLSLVVILLCNLFPHNNGAGVTIDLIHRDSPRSPSHDPSLTRFDRLRKSINRSFSRKSVFLSKISPGLDATTDAPLTSGGGSFLIEYKIGTPPVRQFSIADTGSDLTWIQCKPCTTCYKQDYPLFDPAATSTYKPLGCQTNQCAFGGSSGCGPDDTCQYQVSYGDQSFSDGVLATDTLTLGTTLSLPNFVFGCGTNNGGTFGSSGSGIFGLGNGAVSIVNQQAETVRGRFSYCLTYIDANATSKISFGSNAVVAGPNVLSTPLVNKEPDTFYYLTLESVSVGSQRFEHKPTTIMQQTGSKGNIIIDSGTTLTFVPAELYDSVETSLKNAIRGTPVADPQGTFNLCYRSSGGAGITSPPVTAHFDGADLLLPQRSIFVEVEEGLVCLTLVPSQDLAIFGNLHQADYLVGYDVPGRKVSFLKTDCSKSR